MRSAQNKTSPAESLKTAYETDPSGLWQTGVKKKEVVTRQPVRAAKSACEVARKQSADSRRVMNHPVHENLKQTNEREKRRKTKKDMCRQSCSGRETRQNMQSPKRKGPESIQTYDMSWVQRWQESKETVSERCCPGTRARESPVTTK